MSDIFISATPFHIGEYIKDEIEARNWSVRDLAERMGGDDINLNHCQLDFILAAAEAPFEDAIKDMRIDTKLCDQLGEAFGTSGALWWKLDQGYRQSLAAYRLRKQVTK